MKKVLPSQVVWGNGKKKKTKKGSKKARPMKKNLPSQVAQDSALLGSRLGIP